MRADTNGGGIPQGTAKFAARVGRDRHVRPGRNLGEMEMKWWLVIFGTLSLKKTTHSL